MFPQTRLLHLLAANANCQAATVTIRGTSSSVEDQIWILSQIWSSTENPNGKFLYLELEKRERNSSKKYEGLKEAEPSVNVYVGGTFLYLMVMAVFEIAY